MQQKIRLAIAIFLVFSGNLFAQNGTKELSLEDFTRDYTFRTQSVYGIRSMNDGEHYTTMDYRNGKIYKYAYATGLVVDTLFDFSNIADVSDYEFSSDETKLLITSNAQSIYRHSFTADYYVVELANGTAKKVSDKGAQQLASFSPKADKVAFVRQNNLFIKDLTTGKETQITTDGEVNKIINGAPDWVYEEEFSFSKAFEWSPDGSYIAYIRFDESAVKEFSMTMFAGMKPELSENSLYPEVRTWKYPKAGDDNSKVSIHVYELKKGKDILFQTTDEYIPRIKWTNDAQKLAITSLNRLQNQLEIHLLDAKTGKATSLYKETNASYIEITDHLTFIEDKYFVFSNESDGYQHLYLYNMDGSLKTQLTKGEWDITDFYGYDAAKQVFYYQSSEESPMQKAVYSVDINGQNKTKLSVNQGSNSAVFSNSHLYYINYYSNATTQLQVTLHNSSGEVLRTLQDNAALTEQLADYKFGKKEFFSFTTSEDVQLNGWMIKPSDFDATKQYPVFMYQYSGPNSQSVQDNWGFDWHYFLAEQGYIVACVDPRGTGARGEAFRKITYQQLGKYETADQIEAAKYLGSLPYTDAARIGIWGWSYGGFMATSCLAKGADVFKMAIAVAPVTNWRYYDNIYTERYMRTPQENASGYDDNSPINHVDKITGKLLLVHGTGDDNVHLQNSAEFAEALVQANVQFDMAYYTNRNHGIYGGNTRYHLYTKIYNFIQENL